MGVHCQSHLRECALTWIECGFSVKRWALCEAIEGVIGKQYPWLREGPGGRPTVHWLSHRPSHKPEEPINLSTYSPPKENSRKPRRTSAAELKELGDEGRVQASVRFFNFIQGPRWNCLGRCPACGHFWINLSGRLKRYCSRLCSTRETAREAVRKRHHGKRSQKIADARRLIMKLTNSREWATGRVKNWRRWVVAQGASAELTLTFLTRAVNAGDLVVPSPVQARRKPN